MRTQLLPVALAAILPWAMPAAAERIGAPTSTLDTSPGDPVAYPPAADYLREAEAAHILNITPRPRLNIDCGPAQERAARTALEKSQYRLKCGQ